MNQFSKYIRILRKQQNIPQREVAAYLKTDTAFISKLEKGERRASREQVLLIAKLFKVTKEELLSLWLGDKVYNVLKDEDVAMEAMQVAENNLKIKTKHKRGK